MKTKVPKVTCVVGLVGSMYTMFHLWCPVSVYRYVRTDTKTYRETIAAFKHDHKRQPSTHAMCFTLWQHKLLSLNDQCLFPALYRYPAPPQSGPGTRYPVLLSRHIALYNCQEKQRREVEDEFTELK
jgi:hypothetical protein